jgi:hypothetical protein
MISQWSSHERTLCLLIPKLAFTDALQLAKENEKSFDIINPKSSITAGALQALEALTSRLASDTVEWDQLEPLVVLGWRYLDVLSSLLPTNDHTHVMIFHELLISLLGSISNHVKEQRLAALAGKALILVSHVKTPRQTQSTGLSSGQLVALIIAFGQNPTFLKGALEHIKRVGVQMFSEEETSSLSDSLILRLTSPSGDVRRLSLYTLELLSKAREAGESDIIRTAAMVEEIPLAISNQRNIAMYVRKLGMDYRQLAKNSWGYRIVPYYCFGM